MKEEKARTSGQGGEGRAIILFVRQEAARTYLCKRKWVEEDKIGECWAAKPCALHRALTIKKNRTVVAEGST